jgi:murein DD-endopeptidase MepM/ murein hydrolase activator NlpD
MLARYYSAGLGRFLSVDPAADSVELENPQTWNRYTYALNNPLRFNDPDGEHVNPVTGTEGVKRGGGLGQVRRDASGRDTGAYKAPREGGRRHGGLDIAAPLGTPVKAVAGGRVTYAGQAKTDPNAGVIVVVDHGTGDVTTLAHLDPKTAVRTGDVVKEGQVVGYVGKTGNSAGDHVHLQVNRGTENPEQFLNSSEVHERLSGPTIRGNPVGHGPSANPGQPMQQRISGVCTNCMYSGRRL